MISKSDLICSSISFSPFSFFRLPRYGIFGAEDILRASSVNTRKEIKLIADGVEVPLPADSQGIILLNIDSYAGGVPVCCVLLFAVLLLLLLYFFSPYLFNHFSCGRTVSTSNPRCSLQRPDEPAVSPTLVFQTSTAAAAAATTTRYPALTAPKIY